MGVALTADDGDDGVEISGLGRLDQFGDRGAAAEPLTLAVDPQGADRLVGLLCGRHRGEPEPRQGAERRQGEEALRSSHRGSSQ